MAKRIDVGQSLKVSSGDYPTAKSSSTDTFPNTQCRKSCLWRRRRDIHPMKTVSKGLMRNSTRSSFPTRYCIGSVYTRILQSCPHLSRRGPRSIPPSSVDSFASPERLVRSAWSFKQAESIVNRILSGLCEVDCGGLQHEEIPLELKDAHLSWCSR